MVKQKLGIGQLRLMNWKKNYRTAPKNATKTHLDKMLKTCLQAEYDQLCDYITQGAIVRSRGTWYEKGEKITNIF